jgi:predicted amidohydrolase YtcJ
MKKARSLIATSALLSLLLTSACSEQPKVASPDESSEKPTASIKATKIFTNAKVYTVNEQQPWAETVALQDNKIIYVGDNGGASSYIGENTETYDLEGKMILPGFFAAHEHLIAAGWTSLGVPLSTYQSMDEYLQAIKDYADANPDEMFIRGGGWNASIIGRNPTAADLDAIIPDRPVILLDYTIHDMWLNSKALEMGQVTKDTEDPVPGLIYWERDEEGNPTGLAKEFAWMVPFIKMGAWQPEEMMAASQEKLSALAAASGMTSNINQGLVTPNIKDLAAHFEDYKTAMKMMRQLDENGELRLRTFVQLLYKSDEMSVPKTVENALTLRKLYNDDKLGVTGIKIHPEGVFSSHASVMLEPWSDEPEKEAVRGVSAERVEEMVLAANEAGLDLSVHTDGTKTNRDTIDAFIMAKEAGYTDARNSLQHYANVHPDDQQRAIKHKIPINVTTIWATTWAGGLDGAMKILGEERTTNYHQQIRTAIDGGMSVSIAADVPSTAPELMGSLYLCEAAITRKDPSSSEDGRIFPPMSQAITLEQCLRSVTIEGAWQARKEDMLGTIEVGKLGDMVILEKNLFDVPSEEIADTKILGTIMDGNFTYRDGI